MGKFGVVTGFNKMGKTPILYVGCRGELQEFEISPDSFDSLTRESGGKLAGSVVALEDGVLTFVGLKREVFTADVLRKAAQAVGTIVASYYQSDGSSALVRTPDGQAYEIVVRQAKYTTHPSIREKYTKRDPYGDDERYREAHPEEK